MTEDPSVVERRATKRTDARPPFEVKLLGAKTLSGVVHDVSSGGMLLEVEGALPRVGAEVQLKFQLPGDKQRMVANATVVRHAGPKLLGLRFLRLSNDELSRLQRYVDG
jgi:c-di-GMP-binding flagellar brake protein YcgR